MSSSIHPSSPFATPSLLRRVAISTTLIILILAVLASLVGVQLSNYAARSGIEQRATTLAMMVRARVAQTPAALRGSLAQQMMERVGALITVIGPDGLAIKGATPSPIPARELIVQGEPVRKIFAWEDKDYFVATEPVSLDDKRHIVMVALVVSHTRVALGRLFGALATILVPLGLLGIAVAIVITREITKDVAAIERRAQQMAVESTAVLEPLSIRALDEVGELVTAFNRLQHRFAGELAVHRESRARLEDAERRKEALIATLRHELRTPLNSIIGFAELLLSGVDGKLNDAQTEDIEVVSRSGRNLLQLVDDVLDLSAIASGRFKITTQTVDLGALAREVVREAGAMARLRRCKVRVEQSSSAGPIVEGDPLSLRRVITNLLHNAIQHAGGEVVVELGQQGRNATVTVRDNGVGINAHDLKRLFKPFERGRTGEGPLRGVGLGLAITVALLELHGGTLRAESQYGQGSKFIASLPLRPTALAQAGLE